MFLTSPSSFQVFENIAYNLYFFGVAIESIVGGVVHEPLTRDLFTDNWSDLLTF